jgi:hypothetical protein
MGLPFTGKQPFSEDAFRLLQGATFGKAGILGNEDIADVIRMIREEHLLIQHFECDEVSIAATQILQKRQGIPAKSEKRGGKGTIRSRRMKCLQGS